MSKNKPKPLIILVAGGTGGHIFPAVSVAKELEKQGKNILLFTDSKFESYKSERTDVKYLILPILSRSKSLFSKINFCISLLHSYLISCIKILKLKPYLIIGFGGYTTFPTLLAARHLSVKIVLHEQNIIIGKVNKFYLKYSEALAISFPEVYNIKSKYRNKCIVTGNPIDQSIVAQEYNYDMKKKINLLIIGGSQGAAKLDLIISNAIILLPYEIKRRLSVVQQCTKYNIKNVIQLYQNNNIKHEIKPFFTDLIPKLLQSHLVISRAGATSISEITSCNKPAIYIPYPYSTDSHQLYNAQYMEKIGTSILIEEKKLSIDSIALLLETLLCDKNILMEMSSNSKNIFHMNAANNFYNMIENLNYLS